jgi:hypothetical protein
MSRRMLNLKSRRRTRKIFEFVTIGSLKRKKASQLPISPKLRLWFEKSRMTTHVSSMQLDIFWKIEAEHRELASDARLQILLRRILISTVMPSLAEKLLNMFNGYQIPIHVRISRSFWGQRRRFLKLLFVGMIFRGWRNRNYCSFRVISNENWRHQHWNQSPAHLRRQEGFSTPCVASLRWNSL